VYPAILEKQLAESKTGQRSLDGAVSPASHSALAAEGAEGEAVPAVPVPPPNVPAGRETVVSGQWSVVGGRWAVGGLFSLRLGGEIAGAIVAGDYWLAAVAA